MVQLSHPCITKNFPVWPKFPGLNVALGKLNTLIGTMRWETALASSSSFFFFKHTKNFQCFKEWAVSSVSMFQEHSWLVLHPILLSDSNRVMEARRERMDYRGFRCDIQWARVPSCPDTRGRVVRQGRGEGQPSRWRWSSPWGHCLHVPVGKLSSQQCLWPCSLS